MIKKLPEIQIHSCAKINEKLNEVIDWINDVSALRVTDKQVTANLPNIDVGELAFLSKENSDLKDEIDRLQVELDRTRKALDVAVDATDEILVLDSGKFCKEPAEMWKIAKSAKDKITALEQKDVK